VPSFIRRTSAALVLGSVRTRAAVTVTIACDDSFFSVGAAVFGAAAFIIFAVGCLDFVEDLDEAADAFGLAVDFDAGLTGVLAIVLVVGFGVGFFVVAVLAAVVLAGVFLAVVVLVTVVLLVVFLSAGFLAATVLAVFLGVGVAFFFAEAVDLVCALPATPAKLNAEKAKTTIKIPVFRRKSLFKRNIFVYLQSENSLFILDS